MKLHEILADYIGKEAENKERVSRSPPKIATAQ